MFELSWISHDDPLVRDVATLRHEVLMAPFGVSRDDNWGDDDPNSFHLVALQGDRVVGYSRLIRDSDSAQIRQVAVAFDLHGSGIGSALMAEMVRRALELGLAAVFLNARLTAVPFYERLGFTTVSESPFPYGRTGVLHVRMEYRPAPG